ncbi:PorP/SprF family type IX secretion system membrane protein [Ferruginibacter albus]|uniref:PorP/SprF family type IX secretion system membrane protein n=1 Tax=Ferruginibacter albus TaxID=2875540 RepID=UPI001CC42C5D|nr:PorP/SprF family type IX secretion system membrane protein [Ferruginibacter albus]UAY51319.1 PorP/SprF family type IX secretion system membrane protein [Ferruginibacter albus]
MRIKFKVLFFVALCVNAVSSFAQVDPHFSQYYAFPLYLNPSLTGVMDGDYRATAIYRNQWSNIDKPFSTIGVSGDMTTTKKVNIGISAFNQTAGNGGYNYLNANLSVAYTGLQFDQEGYEHVSIGLQLGMINRKFDPTKMKFGDQWTQGIGFDPSSPTIDQFSITSSASFTAGAGATFFNADPGKKLNSYLGFSAMNLTQPTDPFLSGGKTKLPIRYTVHGGLRYQINPNAAIIPNFIYMVQGNAQEVEAGAYLQLKTSEISNVLAGVNYREYDAIAPYAGLYYKNLLIGLSYDINTSTLGKAVANTNSFELSLTVTGRRKENIKNYNFICPRL